MKVRKNYTITDTIIVTDKAIIVNKPKTRNPYWRKSVLDSIMISQGLQQNQSGKSWKRLCICQRKKLGGEGFQETDLEGSQELRDTTSEELTKDNLLELHAFEPMPDDEEGDLEVVPENKLTVFKRRFWLFKPYQVDRSIVQTLKLKQTAEELVLYKNILGKG